MLGYMTNVREFAKFIQWHIAQSLEVICGSTWKKDLYNAREDQGFTTLPPQIRHKHGPNRIESRRYSCK